MSKGIRQSSRSAMQRYLTDPLVGGLVFCVVGCFKLLPACYSSAIGGCLGKLFYHIMKKRNRIGRQNLEIAFPDKTFTEREVILKSMWEHWGRVYGELPHAANLYKNAHVSGLDCLKKQAMKNQGCLVCSAHLGNFEISASIVSTSCLMFSVSLSICSTLLP